MVLPISTRMNSCVFSNRTPPRIEKAWSAEKRREGEGGVPAHPPKNGVVGWCSALSFLPIFRASVILKCMSYFMSIDNPLCFNKLQTIFHYIKKTLALTPFHSYNYQT